MAYSLYKRSKVSFILEFAEEGRQPTPDEFRGVHRANCIPQSLEGYRLQAETLLQLFAANLLEEKAEELQREFDKNLIEKLTEAKRYWRGVWQNVAANFIALVITAMIVIAVTVMSRNDFDIPKLFSKWWDSQTEVVKVAPKKGSPDGGVEQQNGK